MLRKMKALSLFSGVGGLDSGFLDSNEYEILAANDIKKSMVNSYSTNFKAKITNTLEPTSFPQVVLSGVAELEFSVLSEYGVDIIFGGPPCQDFSVLRSSTTERHGITVKRGGLYSHFVRALATIQPKAFVFENVPGLKTANHGDWYKAIVDDFSNLNANWNEVKQSLNVINQDRNVSGYDIIFSDIVKASSFGVPQNRRRLILVGLRKDLMSLSNFFDSIRQFRNLLSAGYDYIDSYPIVPIEVFEGKPLPELQGSYLEIMTSYKEMCEMIDTPIANQWKRRYWDNISFDIVRDYLMLNQSPIASKDKLTKVFKEHERVLKELGYYGQSVHTLKLDDGSNRPPNELVERKEKVMMIPPGQNYRFLIDSNWEIRKNGVSQIYRRLHPLMPSYTVVAFGGGGMAMYHYDRNRSALTNREKARLQTFPDTFLFSDKYTTAKAEIGEAVPPLLAKRIATAIARLIESLG